ncbi:Outer membrane protein assembly factor BamD [compost metagenome]
MTEAYQRLGLDDLAATSLATLKLNYPEHATLESGEFVAREEEADSRSWLSKATLGLIETETPLPPGETRASQDVIRQYEDAVEAIPEELQPENAEEAESEQIEEDNDGKRSWWNRLTFGLFD